MEGCEKLDSAISDWGSPKLHAHRWFGLVTQSCLTLCEPTGCSPSGSSVHGIFQATMEWVAVPFSRGTSRPRESNLVLLHCRWILYQLSHQSPPCTLATCRICTLPLEFHVCLLQWYLYNGISLYKVSNPREMGCSLHIQYCIHPKTSASNYSRPDNGNTRSKGTGAAFIERLQQSGKTDQPTQHNSS